MTKLVARVTGLFPQFGRDRKGAVAVLIASGIIIMVAAVGMATDVARGYLLKSRLGQALDAAALAGGRSFFSATRNEEILAYFNANFPPGFMDAELDGPHITVNETAGTVFLTAEATIDTTFIRALSVLGYDKLDTMTVKGSTEVLRETKALDLVISIDMSGSMGSNFDDGTGTRIEAARQAALDLIDILFGAESFKDLLNVGVVPWNSKVNVTINGEAYDPEGGTSQPVDTPYDHPLTGATVNDHYFANNSPVPLLNPLPAPATYTGGLRFTHDDGSGESPDECVERQDGTPFPAGFVVGGVLTVTDAGDNNGEYTIVGLNCNEDSSGNGLIVYPDLEQDSTESATLSVVYHWPGCVYARYIPDGSYPNADEDVDFDDFSDPEFADDADTDLYAKDFQPPKDTNRRWAAWEPITGEGEAIPGSEECELSHNNSTECTDCLSHGITPLQNTKQGAVDAINELVTPNGSTNLAQGLVWAWRVLMPGAPFDEATPNDELTSDRQQAIILLSDGLNQGWYGDAYKGPWGANTTTARNYIDDRLRTLAARIKDYHNTNPHARQGPIEIYTIQFGESSGDLADLLKEVATKPTSPYYHFAPDRATLQSVFREVANHLTQLRISK